MPDLIELHRTARALFDHALTSVDPRPAVKDAIIKLDISAPHVYSVAIGKAATSMVLGLEEALGEKLATGVIVSTSRHESTRWQSFIGGHPLPNEQSLVAARAAFALLDRANYEEAAVIFLISGGGSAMMEWPRSDRISLSDLRTANQDLISCGASIAEVNSVRRAFSAVKGGGLARRSPRAEMFTLIVSDVNPGDEASVASGPTLPAPAGAPNAMDVVQHYQLETVLPESIMNAVRHAQVPTEKVNGSHVVILDNQTAIDAAYSKAVALGLDCSRLDHIREQRIQDGCDMLVSSLREPESFCAISGGEFLCPVRGDGRGGRNLETALRCAIALDNQKDTRAHFVVLSAGTDGIDGNTPAAGAIADESTLQRARALNLDAEQYLARSDSYSFFENLDDLIFTGPTGTNVRDLRILMKQSA